MAANSLRKPLTRSRDQITRNQQRLINKKTNYFIYLFLTLSKINDIWFGNTVCPHMVEPGDGL